jgi:hypothetical protein
MKVVAPDSQPSICLLFPLRAARDRLLRRHDDIDSRHPSRRHAYPLKDPVQRNPLPPPQK